MHKRLLKEESREGGSFDGTEMNWAEDHASFRVSCRQMIPLSQEWNWEYRSMDNLDDVFINGFLLV
jgi:catabolite regulation protein CreA